ncbi:MAG: polysaccharide biosynthesis protein [Oscillospiraceae bacterium]|nr:polysaccharide biosynthesis protein [Oscillospiraceae bacterium]
MQEAKKSNFLKGAAILAATGVFVKIIGAIYQIPILRELGDEGAGYFHVTYMVYAFILAISTAGVPVAMSRLVSSAAARGDNALIKRYFSVAMPAFIMIGLVAMLLMYFFADNIADLMNTSLAAYSIRVLSPAVFFVCIIAVYRGYAQGFGNMVPTAASQVVEVVSKAAIGIAVVFYLSHLNYEAQFLSAGAITGVTIGLGLCIPLMMWYKGRMDDGMRDGTGQGDGSSVLLSSDSSCVGKLSSKTDEPSPCPVPSRMRTFLRIMKVCIPISLSASFMSIMGVIDTGVVSDRLQNALMLTESEAIAQFGIFRKGLSIYNLPPSLVVPLAVSIIPAIAGVVAQNNKKEASSIVQSSAKLTNLFAMPACAGIMVLAGPILKALYYDPTQTPETFATMTTILVILGAASYFVCFQHLTIAVLQANGYERVALMTFPVGAAVKIALSYFLVGNPNIGIIGSPIGTLACFAIIVSLNVIFITVKVKERFKIISGFLKPLICAGIMAGVSYLTYEGVRYLGSGYLGTGNAAVVIYLAAAIIVGVVVYATLVILTRAITKDDLSHIPKGEKLAKLLRVK